MKSESTILIQQN